MKTLKYSFLFVIAAFVFNACSESLEEINIDPTKLTSVDLRLMLPEAIVQSYFNEGSNPARVAGIIMQQFVGLDAQQADYGIYILPQNAMDNYWNTGLYSGALRSCQVIIDKANDPEINSSFFSGVAKVLMANQYGLATSYFGDIPMSEALQGIAVLKPKYDSQESVYAAVQAMLDDAISDLQNPTGYTAGDLVFSGDAASWIATANALKARFYMHTSKRNAGDIANAMAAVQLALPTFVQPNFTFENTQIANHSLAKFGTERPGTLGFNPQFAAMLDGDPRAITYFVSNGTTFDYWAQGTLPWSRNDATIPLISLVELKMIQAECMTRSGQDGSTALAEAIIASMAQVGVDDAGGYANANSNLSGLSQTDAIEKIMTEAYKAYYGYNFHETWSNYRRTGFPAITPNGSEANGLNPGGAIPKRYLYADTEAATNSASLEAAQAAQSGGLLNIPVWAFQ